MARRKINKKRRKFIFISLIFIIIIACIIFFRKNKIEKDNIYENFENTIVVTEEKNIDKDTTIVEITNEKN